jgi:hypothetical protein
VDPLKPDDLLSRAATFRRIAASMSDSALAATASEIAEEYERRAREILDEPPNAPPNEPPLV